MGDALKVLITDRAWPDCHIEREILSAVGAEVIEAPDGRESTLVELAADASAIATCWAEVTEAVINATMNCRIIARFGIGLDNIAIETATSRGIPVTYVPDYCVPEVSDHAVALLLTALRKTAFFHQQTKSGHYALSEGPPLRRLAGQRLGLIGLGRIGQAVVPKARALGFEVVAHTLTANDHDTGCPMLSIDELLRTSDAVSLHLPLTDATHQIINADSLNLMPDHAVLINTSRGGLIDHAAVWDALRTDRLGGLALDVFDPEPPDLSDPLFADHRVIATPHAAFLSRESLHELRSRTARQIADVLDGRLPEHVVNPAVCEHLRPAKP
ncbi:MAG: C-terminal binding protein [Planctomycetaceae bacterium]